MQLSSIRNVKRPMFWVIPIAAIGVIGIAAASYLVLRRNVPQTDIADLTVPVELKTLTVLITANGTVQPIKSVNLSPKTQGRLAKLYVEQGDRVNQGQIIAQMESREIQAQLIQFKANLERNRARLAELKAGTRVEAIAQAASAAAQAEAQIVEAESRLRLAKDRVRRNQFLAGEGAIARDDLDAVLNEARSARASLDQAKFRAREAKQRLQELRNGPRVEEVAQAEATVAESIGQLREVQVRQSETLVRAPFAGIITQKYATEGSFVTPTTSASSTTSATSTSIVALASGMEVLAEVPEVNIGQIEQNQKVEIVADAYPDLVFIGRVRLIAPEAVVEENVTSFQVRVSLVTGQDKLRSGMNVDLTFIGDELSDTLVVPTVAIVTKNGETGVLVPGKNNKAQFQPVTIGPAIGNQIPILDGIQAGEQVFIDLPKGQKLEDALGG